MVNCGLVSVWNSAEAAPLAGGWHWQCARFCSTAAAWQGPALWPAPTCLATLPALPQFAVANYWQIVSPGVRWCAQHQISVSASWRTWTPVSPCFRVLCHVKSNMSRHVIHVAFVTRRRIRVSTGNGTRL